MEEQRLIRLGGLLYSSSGALLFLAILIHPSSLETAAIKSAMWKPSYMGLMVANLLALPGLAVLHMRLVSRGAGVPALTGMVLAMLGTGLYAAGNLLDGAVMPTAAYAQSDLAPFAAVQAQLALASVPAFGFGYLLTAVAAYRSGLLPKAAGIMLGAGAVAQATLSLFGHGSALVVALPASGLFFAAAQVWFGAAMVNPEAFARVEPAKKK